MNFIAIVSIILSLGLGLSIDENCARPPDIVEVQQRAISHARLEADEISSWKKRARYQAFLPQLQLDYERRLRALVDININESVYVGSSGVVVGPDEGDVSYNDDDYQNFSVKAVWSFNETIFNPDMLNVSAEARRLSRERQYILSEVTKSYYERERIQKEIDQLERMLKVEKDNQKIKFKIEMKEIALKEAAAELDGLTGGWFSQACEGEELR